MKNITLVLFGMALAVIFIATTSLTKSFSVSIDLKPDPSYGNRGAMVVENYGADRIKITFRGTDMIVDRDELREAIDVLAKRIPEGLR